MPTNGHDFTHEPKILLKCVPTLEIDGVAVFSRRPSIKKIKRWANSGYYGVKLEASREGNDVFTSAAAVRRFLEAIQ